MKSIESVRNSGSIAKRREGKREEGERAEESRRREKRAARWEGNRETTK